MAYTKSRPDWIDFPSTATLVRAQDIDNWEQGIADAHSLIAASGTSATAINQYTLASSITAGDTTFTLDRAPTGLAKGAGFVTLLSVASGSAYSTNAQTVRVTSVAGAVVTPTVNTTLTATNIAFVAATKRITGTRELISRYFPGETVVITGSASNNGTFTVANYATDGSYDGTYITVNETVVNESAGASVTIRWALRAHAAGTIVLIHNGPMPVTWYGAKASALTTDATTNRLGIQRCLNDAYYSQCFDIYLPGFVQGRYYIDGPLYLEKITHFRGVHHKASVIAAHTTFPTWDDNVAMITTRRNGYVCTIDNGGNDRYYLTGMGLDGGNVAYLKSPGFTNQIFTGNGYSQVGTNTFAIHATWVGPTLNYQAIVIRAVAGGTGGNSLRVAFVNDGASQPLTVSVATNDITVHLATNGSSTVTSTHGDVIAAINASGPASALVVAQALSEDIETILAGVLAIPVTMTALTYQGTAPFVSGDVGRSIYIGHRLGARHVTAVPNAYSLTVDGDPFELSHAGRKWAVSPISGFMGSFNNNSVISDIRIEDCVGYSFLTTGTQEVTVRNLMSSKAGIHIRLLGSEWVHFDSTTLDGACDAFITFEPAGGGGANRSAWINFIGTHLEGDVTPTDCFRVQTNPLDPTIVWSGIQMINNQWTISPGSCFLNIKEGAALGGSYTVNGASFAGENVGQFFLRDETRGLTVPLTAFATGNQFECPFWAVGLDDTILTVERTSTKTAAYTAGLTDGTILANAVSAAFDVSLPSALGIRGKRFTIKRINSGANAVTINPDGTETIDGDFTKVLSERYDLAVVESDGANWMRIDSHTAGGGGAGLVYTATFEAGTATSAVTTAVGEASATRWTDTNVPAGSTFTYSTTQKYAGTLSGKYTTDGTGPDTYAAWISEDASLGHYGRIFVYRAANPAANLVLARFLSPASARACQISILTDGKVRLQDQGGSTIATTTASASLNQWVRLEWHLTHNTSTGTAELKLFNTPGSTTATETINGTGLNTLASSDRVRIGVVGGGVNSDTMYVDNIIAFASSYPGP